MSTRFIRQLAKILSILPVVSVFAGQSRQGEIAAPLPPGLSDHGVAAAVGQWAWGGPAAAVDAEGRRFIVGKLWSGYDSGGQDKGLSSYLLIDAETGETTQINPERKGRGGICTFLSPDNKLYDTLEDQLIEVDVNAEAINRVGQVPEGRAMSWTIDDAGVIYFGMYPNSELVSYNPRTHDLKNHGLLAKEDWPQYPILAADKSGWIYSSILHKRGNIIAFNPRTGERRQLLDEAKRGYVDEIPIWRGADGQVYARLDPDPANQWYRLYDGRIEKLAAEPKVQKVSFSNTTTNKYGMFPDGSRFKKVDAPNRRALILDAGAKEPREITFDYSGRGARVHTLVVGPDGKIYGSTGVPLRIFRFDPDTGRMNDWGLADHGGHVNQFVTQGNKIYGAVYSSGSLIEYDPAQPFDNADILKSVNPKHLHGYGKAHTLYGRPLAVLAHPDGAHVLLSGIPNRGLVGGGLLIYNIRTGKEIVLSREDLIPDQCANTMAALPNGDIIVGTSIEAGTGGTSVATRALLYRLDWKTKKLTDQWPMTPATSEIRDLLVAADGLVYGLTGNSGFFVFDPERSVPGKPGKGHIVHYEKMTQYGNVTGSQAPRVMKLGPDGKIYVLFLDAIACIEPGTFTHREVARPGIPIHTGIAIANGRIYFASGTKLWSVKF